MIMNIPFLNKPKLIFYTEYPEITESYPIIPASDYKRKWVKSCSLAFKKYANVTDGRASTATVMKCPGMRNVMEAGYIITTWHDFTIETKDDEFEVFYPNFLHEFLKSVNFKNRLIESFDTRKSPMKIPTGNNFKHIIKIFSPYCFDVPKGYELMILPIQYDDDPKFTACSGSIDGFHSDFNIHVLWHESNGRVTIPAGTPLCQLVLRKKEKYGLEQKTVTDLIRRKAGIDRLRKFNKFIS